MRLCTYRAAGATRLGRVEGDIVVPLDGRDLTDALDGLPPVAGDPVPLAGVELVAPMCRRRRSRWGATIRCMQRS
jgi:hypothetical protein